MLLVIYLLTEDLCLLFQTCLALALYIDAVSCKEFGILDVNDNSSRLLKVAGERQRLQMRPKKMPVISEAHFLVRHQFLVEELEVL